jgi:hypothetical protein
MGFYIKDLYVSSARWHDPLTNPPTVPETSPVLVAAKYHTAVVRAVEAGGVARGGQVATLLPPDDGGWVWPTWWTITHTTTSPYRNPGEVIQEGDYLQILTVLRQSVETVERVMESLKPNQEQLNHVSKTLESAGE